MTRITLLLRIEWQGSDVHYLCPMCRASRMHGHLEDCELAKAIAEEMLRQSGTGIGADARG